MGSSSSADEGLHTRIRQQKVVAELGQQALENDDIDQLMDDAAAAVAETLDNGYCKVLKLRSGGDEVLLRQGVGWRDGLVGNATAPTDRDSQAGYTLLSGEPVIVDDLRTEERFSGSDLLVDHGVVSGISVVIGSVDDPWGVLGTHTTERREFTEYDARFVKNVANVLASAIENERTQNELEEMYGRISDAFFALDEEWRFTHINERAHELINPEGRQLVGTPVWDAFSESEARTFKEAYERAMADQETVSFEEYFAPLDSWFEVRAYPSETGLSVYFQDVTDRKERERELEQTEQRYRTLAEYFPNGIVTLFDDDLRYTLAAGQAFGDLPVSADGIEGQSAVEVWDDDVAAHLEPALRGALDGEERSIEFEYADREWVVHAVPIADERGDVFAGMTMAQDITEQKERERFLRDAKSQLEAAADAGAVGTWEWRIPEDTFVAGASFATTFGVDPEAAREGVSLDQFVSSIHEADRDRVEAKIEEAVEACGEYREEYRVWNADGELRWVVARGHVECDEDGNPVTFPGALADITERKRAEEQLQRTTKQLETVFQVLPVGVVVADEGSRLVEANDAAKEIWGGDVFDAESVAEHDRYPGWWTDTGEPVEPGEWAMSRVLDGEELTDPDVYEIETVDGERRIVMAHGMPVRNASGELSRGVVTLTDITERREYQRKLEETVSRLEESNERLEQFAYAASHDLQEPLRMVSSYLQLVERRYADDLDDDATEFIEFAVDGADRMREMIDGLLAYSRVDSGGHPFEPVDLNAVVEDSLEDLRVRIDESGADIEVDSLPRVEGDEGQLRQVFQNLLDNAIEYSGDDPPRVRITAERDAERPTVSVRDDGVGVDPADADRVFEIFQSLPAASDRSGTGIGLALCERIVERHGGDIWVDSEPGEGSTFSFTLQATRDARGRGE